MRYDSASDIVRENDRRNAVIFAKTNPVTGEASVCAEERAELELPDFPIKKQWIPVSMLKSPLVRRLKECGSVSAFLSDLGEDDTGDNRQSVVREFVRLRCLHDFAFWAAVFVWIKRKGGGEDCLFRLTRPQRRFVGRLEKARLAGKPVRIVLLKARQWGGSTTSQLYMAWLQLMHKTGLNSLIIAHQGSGSDEIKDMFDRMIAAYPVWMLHKMSEAYSDTEPKIVGVGHSGSINRVPQRNCKIKIGTAERPDSCRGGDYNLVHLSEVGLWKATDGKKPEDIVRAACAGVLYEPYTMIVYESTANGTGNFFHKEYIAAKCGRSQFEAVFIAWYDIDLYRKGFANADERETFAKMLLERRISETAPSDREECGKYLWWLWEKGATLEAIAWYIDERKKYNDHGSMAAENPTDDIEAFVHSGHRVFDKYQIEAMRPMCKLPQYTGELVADGDEGAKALQGMRFAKDAQGRLSVWNMPEADAGDEIVKDRYLVCVDVGGRWHKADWSVIAVFDRLFMIDGDKPCVVAQWYGHTDIDILAWKAAQIAKWYNDALLVIESNTVESKEAVTEGDQSLFIFNQIKVVYDNLYAREPSEDDIREGRPRKYGFHTNVKTKREIISNLVKVIRKKMYVERDSGCLDEYINYEQKQNLSYGAIPGEHDDRLMTRAIGLHICFNQMPLPRIVKKSSVQMPKPQIVSAATL